MSAAQVAVVILNYNGRDYLKKFLPAMLKHSKGHHIIVADNASTDDSLQILEQLFPEVQRLVIPENLGFAGGYNYALKQLDYAYFALVNSDVEVTKGWLEPLIMALEKHLEWAAVQPKIKAYKQPEKFEYAGAAGGMIDSLGYPFCRGRLFHETEVDKGQFDDEFEVFWCSGACMLIRAHLFQEAGGFDEHFFAHMEEIDLGWRLQHMGYKLGYIGTSSVLHVGGGTLSHGNPRKTYLNFRNGLHLLYKNLPANKVNRIVFTRLVLDGVAAAKFLLMDRSFSDAKAVWRAHRDFFRTRRRYTKGYPGKSNWPFLTGVFKGSIVWQFFIKGRKKTSEFLRA
jgi:GT2 family glycosyltransferase